MAFTIKDLESLSGIKAHTIRIWEQRYNFLKPLRTTTNIRKYNNEELKTLLTVALLNKYGYKISQIDEMPNDQRVSALLQLQEPEAKDRYLVNELIGFMVDLKSTEFEERLNRHINNNGLSKSINIIFQFLEKVGLLWQSNKVNPAQEHIAANIIRQKIISAIDQFPLQVKDEPIVLLFLPEYEHHELGLLFVYYLLKKKGIATVYLGANVPLKDLEYIVEVKNPKFLYTHLTSFPRQLHFEKFLQQLSVQSSEAQILISGTAVSEYAKILPSNIILLQSFLQVTTFISGL